MPTQIRPPVYESGDLEIDLFRRELRRGGIVAPVGSRAFEILEVLVQAGGELVNKYDIIDRVWPGILVEENTLHAQMTAVRRALGGDREILKTEAGRGYRLLGTWTIHHGNSPDGVIHLDTGATDARSNFPAAAPVLIGREDVTRQLKDYLSAYRMVTLTGPGGIGKTVLALDIARAILPQFDGGGFFIELASLSDPSLVPIVVANSLGLKIGDESISPELIAKSIGSSRTFLIIDNCEHVIDAVADICQTLLRKCPLLSILATSREVLSIDGEYVSRVPPLDVPPEDRPSLGDVLSYGAARLLLARIGALDSQFYPQDQHLSSIVAICRQLDGIPLAIEFAAARSATLGLHEVAERLGDRLGLLNGRRRALPRHRTLRATIDWSYDLLTESERRLLRRVSIFPSGFKLNGAIAVMKDLDLPSGEVAEGVASLVDKSFAILGGKASPSRWRLLETTRAYALEKLSSSGDYTLTARRHAEHFRDFFATFDPDASPEGGDELPRFAREVDNLRAALNWTFSASGDLVLGAALAAAAVKFWLAASLLAECCDWTSKALAQFNGIDNSEQEMVLRSGRALAVLFSQGMTPAAHADLTQALAIAEARGNIEYQQRAVYGLWLFNIRSMPLRGTLALGRRYAELARSDADPAATTMADLFMGTALTYLGEYVEAAELLERTILNYPIERRYRELARLGIDPRASAIGHLSVCLFSRGSMDAAIRVGERAIEEARQVDHPIATSMAMAWPASLHFPGIGAFDTAEQYIAALLEHANRYALDTYRAIAMCAKGRLLAMRGDPRAGLAVLRPSFAQLKATGYQLFASFFHGAFAETLAAAGNLDEGLAEAELALRHAEQMDYMFVPELLRIHGSLIANRNPDDHLVPEQLLLRAIHLAHRQQALYWELNAAVSLAELWQPQGRQAEAYALLSPICRRFTEGFAAPVLVRANALLRATEGCR
ncbi:ATP-binding protein [Bradyrhizobium sp.]|uniref:ATP-binding protein n=1 Tax=Bradyrhizobium sp. TaxID=376 RepID=UPI003C3408F4